MINAESFLRPYRVWPMVGNEVQLFKRGTGSVLRRTELPGLMCACTCGPDCTTESMRALEMAGASTAVRLLDNNIYAAF